MAIIGIGTQPANAAGSTATQIVANDSSNAVQEFLNYMKETPGQRFEDAWLKAHGLTREELAAMSPAKQQAIMKEMQQDIERQMKQAAENPKKGQISVPGGAI